MVVAARLSRSKAAGGGPASRVPRRRADDGPRTARSPPSCYTPVGHRGLFLKRMSAIRSLAPSIAYPPSIYPPTVAFFLRAILLLPNMQCPRGNAPHSPAIIHPPSPPFTGGHFSSWELNCLGY